VVNLCVCWVVATLVAWGWSQVDCPVRKFHDAYSIACWLFLALPIPTHTFKKMTRVTQKECYPFDTQRDREMDSWVRSKNPRYMRLHHNVCVKTSISSERVLMLWFERLHNEEVRWQVESSFWSTNLVNVSFSFVLCAKTFLLLADGFLWVWYRGGRRQSESNVIPQESSISFSLLSGWKNNKPESDDEWR